MLATVNMEADVGNRKRRASRGSNASETTEKRKRSDTNAQQKSKVVVTEKESFSVVEFIFKLRDPNTTFIGRFLNVDVVVAT